ncbi:aldehyde dehydrogenase [Streptomyces sp. C]|nr:aldehyde dehydrogenase [Streptomyces sp. C]
MSAPVDRAGPPGCPGRHTTILAHRAAPGTAVGVEAPARPAAQPAPEAAPASMWTLVIRAFSLHWLRMVAPGRCGTRRPHRPGRGSAGRRHPQDARAALDELARDDQALDLGGARLPGPGFFHEPTVVATVRQDDEIVQEEVFGPVVTVQSFADEEEALRLADGVRHGLAASVWTTAHDRAMRATRSLRTGIVWVNTHGTTVSEMPHGGTGQSGYGSDLSMAGLLDYTRVKHVML